MDEVRDVHPEILIARPDIDRRAQALALHAEPEFAEPLGGQFAIAAFGVDRALERIERDLPHHGVDHVLDLAGEQRLALLACSCVSLNSRRKVSISPNTLAVSASVSGVGAISAPFFAAST